MSWLYRQFAEIIEAGMENGFTKFAICPYGENAWMLEHLLRRSYGVIDILLVDNKLCKYNKNIKGIDGLTNKDIEDRCFILSSDIYEIHSRLQSILKDEQLFTPSFRVQNANTLTYGPLCECQDIESIGRFCCITDGVSVVPNHPLNYVTTHEFMYSSHYFPQLDINDRDIKWHELNSKKTRIGNDVWIGRNVIITNGASIGNGAIIGAGAVVTKDIPDYAVAVGNPARVIRYRFAPEQIEQLNKIKWWDWPVEKIKAAYQDFKNIDVFIEKHATEHEDKTCQK